MHRKHNFEIGLKSDIAVSSLSLLPFFFAFLASFLFFCWAFSRLHFGGKIFQKAFRILEFDERKGRWVVGQDFHGHFQVNVTWFVAFFLWCSWLDCAHSGMVWKISSLCTSYWTKLALTIKTDDVTRSRRDVDLPSGYGQLKGEWVKQRDFSATHINH